MNRYTLTKTDEIKRGAHAAFIDSDYNASFSYRPEFLSNDYRQGKKVLSSIESELSNCDEFCISVAFITMSGITPLLQVLRELEEKGIPGKILAPLCRICDILYAVKLYSAVSRKESSYAR